MNQSNGDIRSLKNWFSSISGKYFFWLAVFTFFGIHQTNAQTEPVMSESPYFTFGKGIGIISPDSLYLFNIRFRMQNRFGTSFMKSEETGHFEIGDIEARIRRLRLRFDGFMYTPKLEYVIQLSFSRGDLDFDDTGFPNIIRDALVSYAVLPNLRIALGQTKLPGNRQRVNSSGDLQFTDRSLVNARFNFDRDFGIHLSYQLRMKESILQTRLALSSGEGRNFNSANRGLAYSSRIEFLPFGAFALGGDYFEGDLAREKKPKLSIGMGATYNQNASRTGGQLGKPLYQNRDITSLVADVLLKYRGFAFTTEWMFRSTNQDPLTMNNAGDVRYVYVGSGLNSQVSYNTPSNIEFALRNSMLWPLESVKLYEQQIQQLAVVTTYYLRGHRAKFQLEAGTQFSGENYYQNADEIYVRFQIELGI